MVNSELLIFNGEPLKIYLDGFKVEKLLPNYQLIKMHGGNYTRPDEAAIVLSKSHYPTHTYLASFDVNWLYDSIEADELQDLDDYAIVLEDDWESVCEDGDEDEDDAASSNPPEPKKPRIARVKGEAFRRKLLHQLRRLNCTDFDSPDIKEERPLRVSKVSEHKKIPPGKKTTERRKIGTTRRRRYSSHNKENIVAIPRKGKKVQIENASPVKKESRVKEMKRIRYTKAEDKKIIKYLIKNAKLSRVYRSRVWEKMAASGLFKDPPRTSMSLRNRFTNTIRLNYKMYTTNPIVWRQFQELNKKRESRIVSAYNQLMQGAGKINKK